MYLTYANHTASEYLYPSSDTTIESLESRNVGRGRYRRKGLKITIGYCGKRKDGDKFMYVWNNNGRILWTGITTRPGKGPA